MRRSHRPGNLADHYAALLTQQASSGVSMRHFARLAGVSACTLYAWKRRLAADGTATTAGSGPGLVTVDVIGRGARPSETGSYEIGFTNGTSLRVPSDFDAARVGELVLVLRAC